MVAMRFGTNTLSGQETESGSTPTPTETLLWTNPNPNSNYSNGEISDSATLTAYDIIRIYYKLQTSSANTLSSMFHLDISMAEWNLMIEGASHMRIFLGCTNGSNQALARTLRQTAAGTLFIGNCRQYNSTTERAGWCIPYEVYGVK